MDLGGRLRRLRLKRGLSIYDVERLAKLHFSTISKYERNERQPSIEMLQRLAAIYNVTVASIFAESDDLDAYLDDERRQQLQLLNQRRELAELLSLAGALEPGQVNAVIALLRSLHPFPHLRAHSTRRLRVHT